MYLRGEEFLKYIKICFPEYFLKKKVLDNGILTNNIQNYFTNCEYYMTDITNDDNNEDNKNLERNLLSAKDLSFANNYFDIILCIESLEYDPTWKNAIININRMLKNNGLLIMIINNAFNEDLTNNNKLTINKINKILNFNNNFNYWDCYFDVNIDIILFIGIKKNDILEKINIPEFNSIFINNTDISNSELENINENVINERINSLTKYDNNISFINDSNLKIITNIIL